LTSSALCFAAAQQAQYIPDAAASPLGGGVDWAGVCEARSVVVQPLAAAGDCLFVFAPAPRAFGSKARVLVAAISSKLSGIFSGP
jgi:hypothetical protein